MAKVKRVRRKKSRSKVAKEKKSKSEIILPTSDNVPPEDLKDYVLLLYGRKAIGKTSTVNYFPGSLTFMFERARRNLTIRQVPMYKKGDKKRKSLDWESFVEYIELFIESDEYQTAIVDTIDRCYLECFKYVCNNAGINHPEQSSKAYEIWDAIEVEFTETINHIQASGKGLVFLSHEKAKPLVVRTKPLRREEEDDEALVARMEPSCKPAGIRVIQEICDFVIYYCYVGNKRVFCVRSPNEYAWTACNFDTHFLDPDGNPIQRFEAGKSPEESYNILLEAYDNKLYDIDYAPPRKKRKKRN
jgi:hypothetical protein